MKFFQKYWIFLPLIFGLIGLLLVHLGLGIENLPKIPCFFKKITSLPCPTCGATRALLSFLKFDFIKSFQYHFVFTLLYFLLDYIYLRALIEFIFKRPYKRVPVLPITGVFIVLLLAYSLLRIFFPISLS